MKWNLQIIWGHKQHILFWRAAFCSLVVSIVLSEEILAQEEQRLEKPKLLTVGEGWSRWRGHLGDAQVSGLPKKWKEPRKIWRFDLPTNGIGGVAVSMDTVVVSSRNANDTSDAFYLLDAESGIELSKLTYPSKLALDYGNSPRATPLILEDRVITLGAAGQLNCLSLESGEVLWTKHLVSELGGRMPQWGYASSPIVLDNKLIVQPGGLDSSFVALELSTGQVVWKTIGRQAAYASPLGFQWNGKKQWINYDVNSFGAWDITQGKRLWEMKPAEDGDFNVPSPVLIDDKLFLVTENNGARLYQLPRITDESGTSIEQIAQSDKLLHDTNSPVRVGNWIAGVDGALVVLDPNRSLATHAEFADPELRGYCSLIVDENRLLVTTTKGTILLVEVLSDGIRELGRMKLDTSDGDILAHPAFHEGILFVRGPLWIDAYRWEK
jgi:outer membrane protein assembly factor BamB